MVTSEYHVESWKKKEKAEADKRQLYVDSRWDYDQSNYKKQHCNLPAGQDQTQNTKTKTKHKTQKQKQNTKHKNTKTKTKHKTQKQKQIRLNDSHG